MCYKFKCTQGPYKNICIFRGLNSLIISKLGSINFDDLNLGESWFSNHFIVK